MKPLYPLSDDESEMIEFTAADALRPDGVAEVLFGILAPSRTERSEVFGYANDDIDLAYLRLRDGLLRLSFTDSIDLYIIDEGKDTLRDLIRGVTEIEGESRSEINPGEASQIAKFTRLLRGAVDDTPATPNEIDKAQSGSLALYQTCRCTRIALEIILDALLQIERALMDGPDRPRSGRSR